MAGPSPDAIILSLCASLAVTPFVALIPTAPTPRLMSPKLSASWHIHLITCMAQTEVRTRVSTTGAPPAIAAETLGAGMDTPGGGSLGGKVEEKLAQEDVTACEKSVCL